jgi:hypothetical protein
VQADIDGELDEQEGGEGQGAGGAQVGYELLVDDD